MKMLRVGAGDCAIASSFISYCGPFVKEMREQLLTSTFIGGCQKLGIPYTKDLYLPEFLSSDAEMGEWTMQVSFLSYNQLWQPMVLSHK